MTTTTQELIKLLDLEEVARDCYVGASPDEGWQRVYGGQVIGQALVAANRTTPADRMAHSLHGYFLRGGDTRRPITYKVDRIRDGRSFTTRRVVAVQNDLAIFNMSISFQVSEPGVEHQFDMPSAPPPDDFEDERKLRMRQAATHPSMAAPELLGVKPIEIRQVDPVDVFAPEVRPPHQSCWMRCREPLPDDPELQRCVLAYLSDWTLLDTATRPHAVSFLQARVQVASLDHAMWFHRPFRADGWLYYVQESPSASGARGFTRGQIYAQDGTLVASTAQEGLIRLRDQSDPE